MMTASLDATFSALADPTRRAILARLAEGEATVNQLVSPFKLSQPAISKHLKVLEKAAHHSGRDAQRRPCRSRQRPRRGQRMAGRLPEDPGSELRPRHSAGRTEGREETLKRPPACPQVTTPTDREIVITREFNAPRELVWDSLSKPELLKRWIAGPPGWEMTACEENAHVGGTFRWVWSGPDGAEMAMSGVYREIAPPERCVRTERFEFGCVPGGGEQLATLVLTENGDKTALTLTLLYDSKEARDGAVASGMDQGLAAGYDRLDEILDGAAV